jgi:hypothetical protein
MGMDGAVVVTATIGPSAYSQLSARQQLGARSRAVAQARSTRRA